MGQDFKDPYASMKFDPTSFDKAIGKIKSGFDASLSEAGMQAGMAAGTSGMNVGRVTADVYSRAASERDKVIGQVEGQKAEAMTQFDTMKQKASADARAEYERNKPGFLDWLQFGGTLATSLVNPVAGALGAGTKLIQMGGKGGKVAGPVSQQTYAGPKYDADYFMGKNKSFGNQLLETPFWSKDWKPNLSW